MNGLADLTVILRTPPSVNRLWEPCMRNGKPSTRRTTAYSAWLREAADTAAYCRHGDKIAGAYALRLTVPDNRGDIGNYEKAVSDALEAGTVIPNDRLAERIEIIRDRSREAGKVLVELWAMEPQNEKPRAVAARGS
jgi:Holliday junction resolvase RusA-like endonuclease